MTAADAEQHKAARETIERRVRLRGHERVTVRKYRDVDEELESLRRPGDEAERRRRLVPRRAYGRRVRGRDDHVVRDVT